MCSRRIKKNFNSIFNPFFGVEGGGGSRLELVAPDEDCTLFSKAAKKLGARPYHICYECENFFETLENLQADGFLMVQPPKIAPAIDGRNVAFLYNDKIGLIELLEK